MASVGYGKSDNRVHTQGSSQSLTLSQVGSINGDTALVAGDRLDISAGRLSSGGDLTLQGKEVNLNAAETHQSSQTQQQSKQSGFSIGITYDPFTAAKTAYDKSMAGSQNSGSTVGKWIAHDMAVSKAFEAASTPIVVTAGRSRSSHQQNQQRSEAVVTSAGAGKQLNIIATGGSIRSQGAQLSAEGDALLFARDHVSLGFALDRQQQSADSSRSGFAIDNRDWLTPFGTFNDNGQGQGMQNKATGSTLSGGGKVVLHTDKGDINLLGSTVAAQNQLTLDAGRHINLLSTQSSFSQSERQVSSGIGSAQISDTEYFSGWMKNRSDHNSHGIEQINSQIGSLSG
ncbi:hemagglutinin repeat-containing protein, partial [Neisseria sp.]|uniref:hemagglutinin repeat-containing protein n=1 Tax=Neisseria sp. TaxID=192066 RepID=UPI00289FDB42